MMNWVNLIWIGCGVCAVHMLVKMMRNRQLYLIDLLKKHVEIQSAWARRRDRAIALAEAEQSATDEKKAKVLKMVNELQSQSKRPLKAVAPSVSLLSICLRAS